MPTLSKESYMKHLEIIAEVQSGTGTQTTNCVTSRIVFKIYC